MKLSSFQKFYDQKTNSIELQEILQKLDLYKCYIIAPKISENSIEESSLLVELKAKNALAMVSDEFELMIVKISDLDPMMHSKGNSIVSTPHNHVISSLSQWEFFYVIQGGDKSIQIECYDIFKHEHRTITLGEGQGAAWYNVCVYERYPSQQTIVGLGIKIPSGNKKQKCPKCVFYKTCKANFKISH
ncbi:MAG: hypothetical protein ACFFC7_14380 [Candidatus Hermodarchaeota archaeon]